MKRSRLYVIEDKMKRKHRNPKQSHQLFSSVSLVKLVLPMRCTFRSNILHFRSYLSFSIWAFSRKAFFVLSRIQLLTASELLTFNHATPLQPEKQSACAKLLPSLDIGNQNTSLALFGIILAQARRPRRKNHVQKKINVSNHAGCNAQHDA